MAIAGLVVFILVLAAGLFSIPFGLPGTLIILAAAIVYGWATHWAAINLWVIIVLAVMAIVAETVDNLLALFGARKYGSSKWGMLGALIGGIAGAMLGSPLFPVIGSIIGAFVGVFAGALAAEWLVYRKLPVALRAGYGAFIGRTLGIAFKLFLALAMIALIVYRLF